MSLRENRYTLTARSGESDGIEFRRTYLNFPYANLPATLKKSSKPLGCPMGGPPGDRRPASWSIATSISGGAQGKREIYRGNGMRFVNRRRSGGVEMGFTGVEFKDNPLLPPKSGLPALSSQIVVAAG
ncbi:hypothetical protein LXL04_016123 [Taraxacum kok-saghyz]